MRNHAAQAQFNAQTRKKVSGDERIVSGRRGAGVRRQRWHRRQGCRSARRRWQRFGAGLESQARCRRRGGRDRSGARPHRDNAWLRCHRPGSGRGAGCRCRGGAWPGAHAGLGGGAVGRTIDARRYAGRQMAARVRCRSPWPVHRGAGDPAALARAGRRQRRSSRLGRAPPLARQGRDVGGAQGRQ